MRTDVITTTRHTAQVTEYIRLALITIVWPTPMSLLALPLFTNWGWYHIMDTALAYPLVTHASSTRAHKSHNGNLDPTARDVFAATCTLRRYSALPSAIHNIDVLTVIVEFLRRQKQRLLRLNPKVK